MRPTPPFRACLLVLGALALATPALAGSAARDVSVGQVGSAARDVSPGSVGSAARPVSSGAVPSAARVVTPGSTGPAAREVTPAAAGSAARTTSPGQVGSAARVVTSGPLGSAARRRAETGDDLGLGVTLGFRFGTIQTTIADTGADSIHYGPVIELGWERWRLGFAFQYADLEFDKAGNTPFPVPEFIAGPTGVDFVEVDIPGEATRLDYDLGLKYALNDYVTPFIGYRREVFEKVRFDLNVEDPNLARQVERLLDRAVGAILAGELSLDEVTAYVEGLNPMDALEFSLDVDLFAVGVGLTYPMPKLGIAPFVVLTGFPYVLLDGEGESFPGGAVEGGVAWLLKDLLDQPVYVTFSSKYQFVDLNRNLEQLDTFAPGSSDLFPLEEEILSSYVGLFYRFDL